MDYLALTFDAVAQLPAPGPATSPALSGEVPWLAIIMRWVHVLSAIIAVGGPFFNRYFLMPAMAKTLEPDVAAKLRERIMGRWKHMVHLLITLFIVSGLYTFLVVRLPAIRTWPRQDQMLYHGLFGIKMVLAFAVFLLASALVGRASIFAPVRQRAWLFTSLFIVLSVGIVLVSGLLRYLPFGT